ncbi:MAG TPA: FMN-binding negative transcriptional regulator [Candidatus Sulfotelmatobacter sp.]
MYIPEHFRVRNHGAAIAFMRANPFIILVSAEKDGPFASHVPVVLRESGEQLIIRGHFAKANPHWRYLEERPQCLTIFHGAHSYISPSLYTNVESVPTWNYGAVHAYGEARLYTSHEDLQGMLHELIATFEMTYAAQWASLDETFRQRMLNHIVGFEIAVIKLEAKFKLSQNRTKEEQANVIASLEKSEDTAVSGIACMMKEQKLG